MATTRTPLIDPARIRLPLLFSHTGAYVLGAGVMLRSLDSGGVLGWALFWLYLIIIGIGVVALIGGFNPIQTFLIADAIVVPTVPLFTGQHPATVHVSMLLLVLASAAIANGRVTMIIAALEAIGFIVGLLTRDRPPPEFVSEAQTAASELGSMLVGAIIGATALVVLFRLLSQSMASQEEALRSQQQTNQLQRRFVSMVSHELRTPLTSIRGFAELLNEDGASLTTEERAEFVNAIAEQSAHLSRLVDDVLIVARIDAARIAVTRVPVALGSTLESVESMVHLPTSKSMQIGDFGTDVVLADPDRLIQVMRNLIENGVKYGGDSVHVRRETTESTVQIVVEDDGPGIPDHLTEDVFTEFVQVGEPAERASSGFGLGLPIARSLVEAMGGSIWVERSGLGGAKFVVELPTAGADLASVN